MKNIKIFPKDWVQLHPYKQSNPVDSYYTSIANRIYNIMEQTELINSFEGDEAKQVAIRIAAYFEDVISELGIWRAFLHKNKELYGKYLPFYTPDDHYYDDEVNAEDVRFLLWHFMQQYHGARKGTFVSPDNYANEATALMIYKLFCDEWTTAPENTRMKRLFEAETRYENQEDYEQLLFWFHYNSYLFTDHNQILTETIQDIWQIDDTNHSQSELNKLIMNTHYHLAYATKTAMLAQTSPEWLALILPESHPDYALFKKESEALKESVPDVEKKANERDYKKFREAVGDKLLLYFEKEADLKTFLTETIAIIEPEDFMIPYELKHTHLALFATPQDGVQIIFDNVECIKDENNPFYNAEYAAKEAISFFIVKHCSVYLLKELMKRGMLPDAQAKSLISEERCKAIITENWEFLVRYFIREYAE